LNIASRHNHQSGYAGKAAGGVIVRELDAVRVKGCTQPEMVFDLIDGLY